jgi:hypothetical protein
MKSFIMVCTGLTLLASPLAAQQTAPPGSPALVKYGKWGLLAASVVMNLLAREAHQRADDEFGFVTDACAADRTRCSTLPNGAYADPVLEQHFQSSLDYDKKARTWLVGGQTALVGAAVGFIWELTRPKGRPDNIPFEPEVSERNGATQVGFRVSF